MRISLRILVIFLIVFAQKSFADDYVSTSDIVKEIEKSLIFDKKSRQKIDFYKKQNLNKKSEVIISAGNGASNKKDVKVDIVVAKAKVSKSDLREKEQLAYNSVLIGQYEVAIELYKQVLKKEPKNSYSQFALATVYQKIGQFRQAKKIYYKMLKDGADNQEEIVGNLLDILIEDSPQDATYLLSRLSVQNPNSANIVAYAALAYSKVKNYEQAAILFERASTLDPTNIDYKYNLAVIYDKNEQYDKAIDVYSEVIRKTSSTSQSVPVAMIKKRIKFIDSQL